MTTSAAHANASPGPASKPRYWLKLKSLSFISAVDTPAQETATAAIIKRAPQGDEFHATVRVAKVADEVGIVLGWAFTSTIDGEPYHDLQGDAIDESDIVKVAADYMESGGSSDEMHERSPNGRAVFLWPLTSDIAKALEITTSKTGLLVGIRPSADVLAKFKSGEYTGFSIDGLGYREAAKRVEKAVAVQKKSLLTTAIAGHTHLIYAADESNAGTTSSERLYNAGSATYAYDSYHSHPWVKGENGEITIGEAAGHTHELAGASAIDKRGTSPHKETAMADKIEKSENEKKLEAELAKAKAFGALSDVEKAHYQALPESERDGFVAKTPTERAAIVKAATENDEVVEYGGRAIRKSVNPDLFAIAKQAKDDMAKQAAEIAKRDEAIEKADLVTLAKSVLGGAPGDLDTHMFIVRLVKKSGASAEQIDKAFAALRGLNATMKMLGTPIGHSGGFDVSESGSKAGALEALEKGLTAFSKANNIARPWTEGLAAYRQTEEGARLARAYDEAGA